MKFDETRKYYVYVWYYKENKKVFYVGKGCKYRYRSRKRDNEKLVEILNNNECDSEIVYGNLTEQEAFELEKQTIDFYRKNNHPLINIQDGGHLPPSHLGLKRKETSKKKASDSIKKFYENNPDRKTDISKRMKEFFQTDEGNEFQRKSIEARQTKEYREFCKNRKRSLYESKEYKDKLSNIVKDVWKSESYRESHSGINNVNAQRVKQFDLNDNFIKEYDTITQAALETGSNISKISAVCKGNRKTTNGYKWKYSEDKNISFSNRKKTNLKPSNAKSIIQYDVNNNFVSEYESINDAIVKNGFKCSTNIIKNLKGETKTAYGYVWKYK